MFKSRICRDHSSFGRTRNTNSSFLSKARLKKASNCKSRALLCNRKAPTKNYRLGEHSEAGACGPIVIEECFASLELSMFIFAEPGPVKCVTKSRTI